MKEQTRIANIIDTVNSRAGYDKSVKALLANKSILAWIIKCCVKEFASVDLEKIPECIQGKPEVASHPVHRNETDPDAESHMLDGNEEIIGDNCEDSSVSETKITYDIRFTLKLPDCNECMKALINVEAQKDAPSYKIEYRVIYYLSRLISGQYGTIFTHSEYNKIEKVYSIWFCMDVPDYKKNTISEITLGQKTVFGVDEVNPHAVDLMQGVIVNLGAPDSENDNAILKLMNTLLSPDINAEEKKRLLENDFQIAMTEELESEVAEMCNLSQSVWQKGIEEGREEGRREGKNEILVELVKEKVLTLSMAAAKAGLSESEFCSMFPELKDA